MAMHSLVTAALDFDVALRAWCHSPGKANAQALAASGAALRRYACGRALAAETTNPDPAADFARVVDLAIAAGLGWPEVAAIVNRAAERNPGRA